MTSIPQNPTGRIIVGVDTHKHKHVAVACDEVGRRLGEVTINAAAEVFFSSLEWEVLSRHGFPDTIAAQAVVMDWCYGFYNHTRRHSSAGMMSPITYETTTLTREAA